MDQELADDGREQPGEGLAGEGVAAGLDPAGVDEAPVEVLLDGAAGEQGEGSLAVVERAVERVAEAAVQVVDDVALSR